MSPNFTNSYSKNLNRNPDCDREYELESFYYLSIQGDLLKITEYALIGSEFHYYSKIVSLGCTSDGFYSQYSQELREQNFSDENIIDELLKLDMHDEEEDTLVGRVAYNNFTFLDDGVSIVGKQIRGIYIIDEYQLIGIARSIYKILIIRHGHIVCDSMQTLSGASLWANAIVKLGEVKIYDTIKREFIDKLTSRGCGVNGVLPWSAQGLTQMEISRWEPKKLSMESCHHIVNIISDSEMSV